MPCFRMADDYAFNWRRKKSRVGSKFQATCPDRLTPKEEETDKEGEYNGDYLDFSELDERIDISLEVTNFDYDEFLVWSRAFIENSRDVIESSPSVEIREPAPKKRKRSKKKSKSRKRNRTHFEKKSKKRKLNTPVIPIQLPMQNYLHPIEQGIVVEYKEKEDGKRIPVIELDF